MKIPCRLGRSLRCFLGINLTNPCLPLAYDDASALIRSSKDTLLSSPEKSRCIISGTLSSLGASLGNKVGTGLCWEEERYVKSSINWVACERPITDWGAEIKGEMVWLRWCCQNIAWSFKHPVALSQGNVTFRDKAFLSHTSLMFWGF